MREEGGSFVRKGFQEKSTKHVSKHAVLGHRKIIKTSVVLIMGYLLPHGPLLWEH